MNYKEKLDQSIAIYEELKAEKREELLREFDLYNVVKKKVKVKDESGKYVRTSANKYEYEDVTDEQLEELVKLNEQIENLETEGEYVASYSGLSIIFNFMGGIGVLVTLIIVIPLLRQPVIAFYGNMILVIGLIGSMSMFAVAAIINLLTEIAHNTRPK